MTIEIKQGDCLELMRGMAAGLVHCCVTSPPYFGLRDYGVEGQLGLESTPDEYVAKMVEVFREVRRVLRDDGKVWLNLGDSYAAGKAGRTDHGTNDPTVGLVGNSKGAVSPGKVVPRKAPPGFKPKDLIGIPWRVAFALQADGWYLRQDIIWAKPNPMPESVRDRCTKAHEYIFLLSKKRKYYYDHDAIREPFASDYSRDAIKKNRGAGGQRPAGNNFSKQARHKDGLKTPATRADRAALLNPMGRNRRSVWTVAPKPFKGAHFAVFPPDLIEPCILAGCPEGGTVLDPFGGSGTTAMVAEKHGRNAILCELNPDYVALAEKRLS